MSDHTPGEWRMLTPGCIFLNDRPVILSYPGKYYSGSTPIPVRPVPYAERKANARLIAGAPGLLTIAHDALKIAVAYRAMIRRLLPDESVVEVDTWLAAARAAIGDAEEGGKA